MVILASNTFYDNLDKIQHISKSEYNCQQCVKKYVKQWNLGYLNTLWHSNCV